MAADANEVTAISRRRPIVAFAQRHRFALVVSATGHALLILTLPLIPRTSSPPPVFEPITVYLSPANVSQPTVEPEPPGVESGGNPIVSVREPPLPQTTDSDTPTPEPKAPTAAAGDAAERTDWATAAREAVARHTPKDEPGFRSFSALPERTPESATLPNLFERPWSRTGRAYLTPEGELVLWVNEDCTMTLETFSLLQSEVHKFNMAMLRCQLGKRKPRSDLFEDMDVAKSQRLLGRLP